MIRLSIIIVSFNTRDLTINCLNSFKIPDQLKDQVEIIIIDNHSTDNTQDTLKKDFKNIKLILNKQNVGFAKANNQGIKTARGEWVLLLNSDTELFSDSVKKIMDLIQNNLSKIIYGCRLLNADNSLQPSCGYLPNLINIFFWMTFIDDIPLLNSLLHPYHITNSFFYRDPHEVGWVTGAFFLTKRQTLLDLNLFDENIFMYGEEVELCLRALNLGVKVSYNPDLTIYHHKGRSGEGENAGITEEFNALKYIFSKHKPAWQQSVLSLILRLGALLRILYFGIITLNWAKLKLYAEAFQMA